MTASAIVLARGYVPAAAALALQLLPGMWKGWRRVQLARKALPQQERWFHRWAWTHAALIPLATWAWLVALASSALLRKIEWRGRLYRLKRPPLA